MPIFIPERLAETCRATAERTSWLAGLSDTIQVLKQRWGLELGLPFDSDEVSCSWVALAVTASGGNAVLKIGMPHMEGEDEIKGLRFWNGDPTVKVLDADEALGAMLLERCVPGSALRVLPEVEQDRVIACLLRRLWRRPVASDSFRPLSMMTAHWSAETLACERQWPDRGLVNDGLKLFRELSQAAPGDVLLATDLHAGNVLAAEREPWLVIDPKPFLGDPAYDATQHLLNCDERMSTDPIGTIRRFTDLLELDHHRIRLWTFARAAAESRDDWQDIRLIQLAKALTPK